MATIDRKTVCKADAAFPRHSEGAVLERLDGTLLLVWAAFPANPKGGEDDAPAHFRWMTSADGGTTWQEGGILAEPGPSDLNLFGPSFVRLPNDEVLLVYTRAQVVTGGRPRTRAVVVRSQDDGRTWGPETDIWRDMPQHVSSNGVARRLSNGRLLLPFDRQTGEFWTPTDHLCSGCCLSDDDGVTWRESTLVDLPMRGTMEAHVEECPDGRVMMVMRTQLGSIFGTYSEDGGETWSKPQTIGLRAPESCPDLIRHPSNGDLILAWNDAEYDPTHSHYGLRSPLSIATSSDGGTNWQRRRVIDEGEDRAFSNPCMTLLRDGTVLMNYWVGRYSDHYARLDLRIARFPLDWLYNGA